MKMALLAVLVLACACAAAAAPPPIMRDTPADMGAMRALAAFNKVAVNVPFNVLVMPGKYSLKVTVMLPAKNLTSANVTGAFDLVIGSGFSAQTFTATSYGAATVSATNITAQRCVVSAHGTSRATVNGVCNTTDVSATGVSSAYVGNVTSNATANAGGSSQVAIKASSPDVNITAALSGVSTITYNQGTCTGSSFFLSSCDQGPVRTPPLTDTWTCGIKVSSTSLRGFFTSDGVVVVNSSGRLVKDGSGVDIITPQPCNPAAPAPAPSAGAMAMAPAADMAAGMSAAPAPSMPMST